MSNQKLEDVFNEMFTGDVLKNALDFAEFLNTNGITQMEQHGMRYNGEYVCYIETKNEHNTWTVWTAGDYSYAHKDFPIDERTKEIAWAHANKCGNCEGVDCSPGKTKMIFGKDFTNICGGADVDMYFKNPDAEALECLKRLVEMRKYIIDNNYYLSH